MGRIFSLLTAVTVLMILFFGGGVYWLSSARMAQVKQDSAIAVANAVALTLSQQIDLLNRTLNKMAQDPETLIAVTGADPVLLTTVAARLEKYFPDVLKIRLLLPGVSEIDEKNVPRMGFADLDMVRETFNGNQLPGIQGYEGADRHLAITARIMQNDRVVGVILASLNYDFFNKSIQAAAVKNGYIELRQAKLVLGASGERVDTGQSESAKTKVPGTDWEIYYYYAVGADSAGIILISSIIVATILLIIVAFFVAYQRLSDLMTQDLDSVLNACKDMMTHKPPGSYPVHLSEIHVVIAALMHFKQIMGYSGGPAKYDLIDELPEYDVNDNFIEEDKFLAKHNESPIKEDDFLANHVEKSIDKPEIIEAPVDLKKIDKMDVIFRAYDIRGIVGKTLTSERVYDIGRALGTDAKDHGCKTVVMGRDGRSSSPMLAEALAQGIVSTGRNVLDIGRVPTPMLYFVTQHTEGHSGIMITGSHKPTDYNGLKMIINGETLAGERIQQIRQCIASQRYAGGETGTIENIDGYTNEYIGTISEDIHIARPMLVVLDCGNGVAGELGPKLLETLGCEVVELFCDVDETFPNHHPDPSNPANLAKLIASVKNYKADLGLAIDGDGDRLGVVDSNGNIICPDRQMMLFAKDVLAKSPGSKIIYDVKCTRHLADQITKYGGKPVMWKTGHSFMKAKLKETGAALAGEMSGHIFFNDRWFGFDDALYSAARLIEILSKDMRSSAEIFAQFPDSINTPELNIELEEGENFIFMESLFAEAHFTDGKITDIDGMRVDFSDGWGLVRASNTTPSLVIRFEADSNEALLTIQNQFRQLMKKIKPDIVLPF
jgi:phosphomannomutase/phosphoglucomutase